MLAEDGGTIADQNKPEKGGACRCWAFPRGGWSYIQKVNRVTVSVLHNYSEGGQPFSITIPFDKLTGIMSAAAVEQKRSAGLVLEASRGTTSILRRTRRQPMTSPRSRPRPSRLRNQPPNSMHSPQTRRQNLPRPRRARPATGHGPHTQPTRLLPAATTGVQTNGPENRPASLLPEWATRSRQCGKR